MKRLKIITCPEKKLHFRDIRQDILIPKEFSEELAEFTGAMLGDGHVSPTQIIITVNTSETDYLRHLNTLMMSLFGVRAHTAKKSSEINAVDTYIGSTKLVKFFMDMGLVGNKVKMQVGVPKWIYAKREYIKGFLRGFFDTDGSIYKLRFGVQVSYKNASAPLLRSTREMLLTLGYTPSKVSYRTLYLTRQQDLKRFFEEIRPGNKKHIERAIKFGII